MTRPGSGVEDRIVSVNAYVVLTDAQAEHLLRRVLRELAPGLAGVQEWDGPKPALAGARAREPFHDSNRPTRDSGAVDGLLQKATAGSHHRFVRPAGGGMPVVYDVSRYDLQKCYGVQLAARGFVGRLPGRRSTLGASVATVAELVDEVLDEDVALVVVHLTAEVQRGKGYRHDLAHRLRVTRHQRERRAIRRLARRLQRRGFRVYVTGDTNFDGMALPPLVACWDGHAKAEAAGTLGGRTPDYVFAPDRAGDVETLPTRSDHHAVLAIYPRVKA